MKHAISPLIITGILFLLCSFILLILCFYGPIVLDVKSTVFIYPLYCVKEGPEIDLIRTQFSRRLDGSRRYIVIEREYAERELERNGTTLAEVMKTPSSARYAEAAKIIGADKFIMGYIYIFEDSYELFVNVHITKLAEGVLKEKVTAGSAEELIAKIPVLIGKLDGSEKNYSLPEILYFFALFFHALFGMFLLVQGFHIPFIRERDRLARTIDRLSMRIPELLLMYSLLLFIFSYIYASNANMDYVQKFMATGGKVHLATSTEQERLNAVFRYMPLLGLSCYCFIWMRVKRKRLGMENIINGDFRVLWAFPLTVFSALLASLSLPNFLDISGWAILGYISLIPLFMVMEKNSYASCVFYGTLFGTCHTVFNSYWLGTFNLVSLQIVMIIFLISYLIFMIPAVWLYRRAGPLRFLVFPAAWVVFDYLQSIGFAGYPWGMFGTSQYGFVPLIQTAAITGVWGITFIVVLANSAAAHLVNSLLDNKRKGMLFPLGLFGGLFILVLSAGFIYLGVTNRNATVGNGRTVRIAQIQDSMDPRKHSTYQVMETLIKITQKALEQKPDLIVWPEGSFDLDYLAFPEAIAARNLREFQESTGTWLLTGTVEYKDREFARNAGPEEFLDAYNAAMLLSPDGEVVRRYYKIHLVPFTEYFPYEKELPWLYRMLKEFDINWWEKGETRVIFRHPKFSFFTPICYEDVFPAEIALFVRDGADVIMNLSNDFWSLSPVEGKQHAVNALFRAVENARPLLRTTTSGLTCYIDINGRIKKRLPYYEEGYYVVDVPLPDGNLTFYTMTGDWFPWFLLAGLCVLLFPTLMLWIRKKRKR
ncbi:MAG: apolipoprotein N-acyltransferase [Spirochaetales bacterium]|nr:apolipoprotein N-acyltransferase [Spirochaetales bacterium]